MKVGILGSGDVGKALAKGFVRHGYDVLIGSRDPAKLAEFAAEHKMKAGSFGEAAGFGDVVVLALLYTGAQNAIMLAGPSKFKGKTVIDCTNPLDFSKGMPPTLLIGHTNSAGEQVQRWLPEAKVVKAFNMVGNAHMVNPDFPGGPPTMLYCGNDTGAKKTVAKILKDFGWDAIDYGDITGARELEPLCILWVKYGGMSKGWNHAFKLLRK